MSVDVGAPPRVPPRDEERDPGRERSEREEDRQRRLDLFLTEACNLACPYCFAATGEGGQMPPERARAAVDWLLGEDADRLHITFWGGEPLLRRDLLRELVARAKEGAKARSKRITFSLPTNATLLDGATARWLSEEGVQIFLSIDGDVIAQRGRPLRGGKSSHALAMAGLRAAREATGRAPAVRMTITPTNAGRVAEGVAFFAGEGVMEVLAYPAFDQPWTPGEVDAMAAGQVALARWLIAALDAAIDPRREVPMLRAWRPILRSLLPSSGRRRRSGIVPSCGAGDALLAVRVDGRLSPCHRFVFYDDRQAPRFDMGVLEGGRSSGGEAGPHPNAAVGALAGIRIEDVAGETSCVACDIFDHCTMGCVAINVAATGDPTRVPEVACKLQRAQVEACRLVVEALGAEDPRLALYLGSSLPAALRQVSARLGNSAWRHYSKSR